MASTGQRRLPESPQRCSGWQRGGLQGTWYLALMGGPRHVCQLVGGTVAPPARMNQAEGDLMNWQVRTWLEYGSV